MSKISDRSYDQKLLGENSKEFYNRMLITINILEDLRALNGNLPLPALRFKIVVDKKS